MYDKEFSEIPLRLDLSGCCHQIDSSKRFSMPNRGQGKRLLSQFRTATFMLLQMTRIKYRTFHDETRNVLASEVHKLKKELLLARDVLSPIVSGVVSRLDY